MPLTFPHTCLIGHCPLSFLLPSLSLSILTLYPPSPCCLISYFCSQRFVSPYSILLRCFSSATPLSAKNRKGAQHLGNCVWGQQIQFCPYFRSGGIIKSVLHTHSRYCHFNLSLVSPECTRRHSEGWMGIEVHYWKTESAYLLWNTALLFPVRCGCMSVSVCVYMWGSKECEDKFMEIPHHDKGILTLKSLNHNDRGSYTGKSVPAEC